MVATLHRIKSGMKTPPEKFRLIDFKKAIKAPFARGAYGLVEDSFEKFLGVKELNAAYRRFLADKDRKDFFAACLRLLTIEFAVSAEDLEKIPKEGPVFVVANHPYGGVDGVILGAILAGKRGDFKLLANSLLGKLDGIQPWLLPVNPFGGPGAARENVRAMKDAVKHLEAGGCLATFPSGEVSSLRITQGEITDPKWNPHIGRMIRQSKATVLPIYFEGHNSALFQAAGLLHPRARTALLVRELIDKRDSFVRLRIGNPIPYRKLDEFEDDEALTEFLRLSTYMLAKKSKSDTGAKRALPVQPERAMEPVIDAVPAALLKAELESLPPEAMLVDTGTMRAYVFHGEKLPHTLREIGRLREITFRAVSEGTGKSADLDEYDTWYEHLVLWDSKENAIAGAYRMGRTDRILESHGKKGLYTSTLFHFRTGFFMKLSPALEMGRSFIRAEYQRKPQCMPTLWRAIMRYCAAKPQYKMLYGPVSINPEYSKSSRDLILAYLKNNRIASTTSSLTGR
jgi:putative hemolysin